MTQFNDAAPAKCPHCGESRPHNFMHPIETIPAGVVANLDPHQEPKQIDGNDMVCEICVNKAKSKYLAQKLEEEIGSLSTLERVVLDSIRTDTMLLMEDEDPIPAIGENITKWANGVEAFVGSWTFPLIIVFFILLWTLINLVFRPYEPYPTIIFAVISAVLGSLAALHGPIILMSQRTQQKRDRVRSRNDYLVNLKAELEVRYLGEQIQLLLDNQEKLSQKLEDLS